MLAKKTKIDWRRAWSIRNPEKVRAIQKRWNRKHPESLKASRLRWVKKNPNYFTKYMRELKYGVGAQAHFDKCWKIQKGRCAICGEKITKKPNLDHCHKTNKLRGVLCPRCNVGLGSFKDTTRLLKRAIAYLKKYKGKRI